MNPSEEANQELHTARLHRRQFLALGCGAKVADLVRRIPAEMVSLLISMDPEKEE